MMVIPSPTQRQKVAKVVVARLILAHLRRHRVRVVNHAALAVLDHLQSQGRVEVGAHTQANLERADQAHIESSQLMRSVNSASGLLIICLGVIRHPQAKVAKADLVLILVILAHHHRVRVVNLVAVVAVLDQHRSQGRVDQDPVATTLPANLEKADHRPID